MYANFSEASKLILIIANVQGADHLNVPIHIVASRASKSAIRAVEKLGGSVFCQYYNRLALYDCVKGRTDRIAAAPTRREDIGTVYRLFSEQLGLRLSFSVVYRMEEPRIPRTEEYYQDGNRGREVAGAFQTADGL